MPDPLLDVRHLSKHYGSATGLLKRLSGAKSAPLIAVDDVSFTIAFIAFSRSLFFTAAFATTVVALRLFESRILDQGV